MVPLTSPTISPWKCSTGRRRRRPRRRRAGGQVGLRWRRSPVATTMSARRRRRSESASAAWARSWALASAPAPRYPLADLGLGEQLEPSASPARYASECCRPWPAVPRRSSAGAGGGPSSTSMAWSRCGRRHEALEEAVPAAPGSLGRLLNVPAGLQLGPVVDQVAVGLRGCRPTPACWWRLSRIREVEARPIGRHQSELVPHHALAPGGRPRRTKVAWTWTAPS